MVTLVNDSEALLNNIKGTYQTLYRKSRGKMNKSEKIEEYEVGNETDEVVIEDSMMNLRIKIKKLKISNTNSLSKTSQNIKIIFYILGSIINSNHRLISMIDQIENLDRGTISNKLQKVSDDLKKCLNQFRDFMTIPS